jgi:heme/copper-type cytochrome/quinol oxidase subunit 2
MRFTDDLGARWLSAVLVAALAVSLGGGIALARAQQADKPAAPVEAPEASSEQGSAAPPEAAPAKRPVRYFKLFADNWNWTPDVIRVKRGTHVVLTLWAERATRSFKLDAYKLNVLMPQEEEVKVEFDADQKGEFPWRCGRPCGNGCAKMRGTLIVD